MLMTALAALRFGALPRWLAERILRDRLPVRFQLQLHKQLWGPDRRGV